MSFRLAINVSCTDLLMKVFHPEAITIDNSARRPGKMYLQKRKVGFIVCFLVLAVSAFALPSDAQAQVHALCKECARFVEISPTGAGLNRDASCLCDACQAEKEMEEALDRKECDVDELEEDVCPVDEGVDDDEFGVCGTPCTDFCDYTTQRMLALCRLSPDVEKCRKAAYAWLLGCYAGCFLGGS